MISSSLPWRRDRLKYVLPLLSLLALTEFVRTGFYAAFLPVYGTHHLGLNLALIGLAMALHYGADSFSKSVGGYLAEHLGLGRMVLLGALVGLVVVFGVVYLHSAWLLLLLAMVHGVSLSPLWPGVMTLANSSARPGEESRAIGFANMAVNPFIGVGFLAISFLVHPTLSVGHEPLAWLILLGLQAVIALLAVSQWKLGGHQLRHSGRSTQEAYRWTQLMPLVPAALVQTLAITLLGPVINLFSAAVGLSTLQLAAMVLLGGLTAYGFLNLSGRLADRYNPRWVLVCGLVLVSLAFSALAALPRLHWYYPIAILAGLGYSAIVPGWGGLVAKSLPKANRAATWGALMTVESLGTASGSLVGGFAWTTWGIRSPFVIAASLLFLAALFYLVTSRSRWVGRSGAAQ